MKCYGYECDFYVIDEINDIEICTNEENCFRFCQKVNKNIKQESDDIIATFR